MSKFLRIGIDVDLTWVDTGGPWFEWLCKVYGPPSFNPYALKVVDYNLSKYFPSAGDHQVKPYDFWEDPFLYDLLHPAPGAVEALEKIVSEGHSAHFISYCKKGHFSSKVRHLKRHTQHFMDLEPGSGHGFYATKNKSMIAVDVIIDDRNAFLNQFGNDVIKIKFDTPYSQDEELIATPDLVTSDWSVIKDFILDLA